MKKNLLSVLLFFICGSILQAQVPYGVYQIPFQPLVPSQSSSVSLGDDQMSAMVPIGFPFSYFGESFDSLSISSNGYITFNTTQAGEHSNFVVSANIPDPNAPQNSIMLSWCDLNPMVGGTISYGIVGTAPNRVCVIHYNQVALFSCNQNVYTGQLQLFEGSNNIEMHILAKPFCNSTGGLSSVAIEGIQNASATEAYAVPGRNNAGVWQAFNDAWRFDPDTVSQPVCVMSGSVVADFNGNCVLDGADFTIPGQVLIRDNGMAYTPTNAQGAYSFEADTGAYHIAFNGLQSNLPFASIVCPVGAAYDVDFQQAGSVNDQLNFFVHPDSACADPRVHISPLGPLRRCAGNDNHQLISVSNNGLLPVYGYTVTLTIPDSLSIISTTPAFTSQNGNTFSWVFTDTLVYGEFTTIHLYDSLSCYATDFTLKCFQADIQTLNDCNTSNNSSNVCQVVNGSYDPNHIQLLENNSPAQFVYEMDVEGNETWYTYRVQFQNTGTAPAQTVVITDVLPSFFDYSSAELLGSSHPAFLVNLGNGTLKFVYNNIALPDSSADFAGSIGTALFRVKTQQQLFPGQEIGNQASIVFDVNEPVITNSAVFKVPFVTGLSDLNQSSSIFPNPADRFIKINSFNQKANRISIIDLNGKQLFNLPISKQDEIIATDQLANGIYFIEMYQDQLRIGQQKLIISHN